MERGGDALDASGLHFTVLRCDQCTIPPTEMAPSSFGSVEIIQGRVRLLLPISTFFLAFSGDLLTELSLWLSLYNFLKVFYL